MSGTEMVLAAVAIADGAGQADAIAEAMACLVRHAAETATLDSAVRMVAEMHQWAKGHR